MKVIQSLVCCMTTLALLSGCGGGAKIPKDRPVPTKVSGIVSMNGAPVEGATVTLHPTGKGYGAFGTSDANGKFVLSTFGNGDGAVSGDYKVSVKKLDIPSDAPQPSPGDPGYDPDPKPPAPKQLLPDRFADFTKSGLTANIGTEPMTDLKIELK